MIECFSYICQGCNKPINHKKEGIEDSVVLYLLQRGEVLETIKGYYNGYGGTYEDTWKLSLDIVNLLHTAFDRSNGVAAYHLSCDPAHFPIERSHFDPNRGKGLPRHQDIINKPYHIVYRNVSYDKLKTDRSCQDEILETLKSGLGNLIDRTDEILYLLG